MGRTKLRPDVGDNTMLEKDVEKMSVDTMPAVKQIVQQLNANTIASMDMELNDWYSMGYRLFSTHLVTSGLDFVTVLYVLVRDNVP